MGVTIAIGPCKPLKCLPVTTLCQFFQNEICIERRSYEKHPISHQGIVVKIFHPVDKNLPIVLPFLIPGINGWFILY